MYRDWESVYRDNVERLYRLMFSRVGNRPDAEDLTAEVFRLCLPALRMSASGGEIRAYLIVTAKTVLAGHWKRRYGIELTGVSVGNAKVLQHRALRLAAQRIEGVQK